MTTTTTVVRIRIENGVVVQDCDIYIGRSCTRGGWNLKTSKWYNPYSVKKYGLQGCIKLYEEHLLNSPDLMASLHELKGKRLGCWCKKSPEIPCHGDVLVKHVNNLDEKEG